MPKTDEIPAQMAKALRTYREHLNGLVGDLDVADARRKVQVLTHRLHAAEAELAELERPYRDAMAELEPYIEGQALELGASCEHAGVFVKYRAGYERITYIKSKIEDLAAKDEEFARKVKRARKVTTVDPKVEIGAEP